jgi:hypothetical protein
MHEPVVSKFSVFYYVRAVCGAVFFPLFALCFIYSGMFANLANLWGGIGLELIFILAIGIFFYFFLKSWRKITVGPEGIVVDYLIFRKQFTIPYASITYMGTNRTQGMSRTGYGNVQYFVIEYGSRSIDFKANSYDNYDELKAEIYNYTLGFDRHRSQY